MDGSIGKTATASKTRPADTNAYTAGDVVSESTSAGSVITFSDVAHQNGGSGYILDAVLIASSLAATEPDFELWLFDTAPSSNLNDNAAAAFTDAEMEALICMIKFPTGDAVTGGANCAIHGRLGLDAGPHNLNRRFTCGSSSRDIYGVLVSRNAYAGSSGEKFTIRLGILQDNLKESD